MAVAVTGTAFKNVCKKILEIGDLKAVFHACKKCSVRWKPIGLHLGLHFSLLQSIDVREKSNPEGCLFEVLAEWLQQHYTVTFSCPLPSWWALCVAVDEAGENPALAKAIAEEHIQSLSENESKNADETLDRDTDSVGSSEYEIVSIHETRYNSGDELKKSFACQCGECSLEKFLNTGCPGTGKVMRRFPLLDVTKLPEGKRDQYIYMLEEETRLINKAFADLCDVFLQSLKARCISVDRIKVYLVNCTKWFDSSVTLEKELNGCTQIEHVFLVLAKICSWLNHDLLGDLVERFGTGDDQKKYEAFVKVTLMKFLKRSVTEIPKDCAGEGIEGSGNFQLKLSTSEDAFKNIKMEYIYRLRRLVAKALDELPLRDLHIMSTKAGCIEVIFTVPQVVYKELFPLSSDHIHALRSIAIIHDGKDFTDICPQPLKIQSIWYNDQYYDIENGTEKKEETEYLQKQQEIIAHYRQQLKELDLLLGKCKNDSTKREAELEAHLIEKDKLLLEKIQAKRRRLSNEAND